jgi:hypothetical protein
MSYAYDESDGRASPSDVLTHDGEGVLIYSGPARPDPGYVDQFSTDQLHHAWIFESQTDRAVQGTPDDQFNNGRSDCSWHETRVPPGEFTYVVACDLNNGSLGGRNTQPYLMGWAEETRESAFGQYGSSDAINQGMRLGGKLQKFWGVVNWNPLGYPNNDPHNIAYWQMLGADLIQLIGTPIPGTDQNLICKPNWWTAEAAAPVPTRTDDMYIGVNKTEGWFVVEGGKVSTHFTGTPGAFGVPADLNGAWVNVPSHILSDAEVAVLKVVAASGGGGGTVLPIDYTQIQQAVAVGVTQGIRAL